MLPDRGRGRYLSLQGFRGKTQNAAAKGTWTIKEKLYLIDGVQLKGENWTEISLLMQGDEPKKETKRGEEDYFSPQNCYRQYQAILETVGKDIRKRGEDRDLFDAVRQYFVDERLKELSTLADLYRKQCVKVYRSLRQSKGEDTDDVVDDTIDNDLVDVKVEEMDTTISEDTSFDGLSNKKDGITNSTLQQPTAPMVSAIGMTEEEDDDLSDLMDILPKVDMDDINIDSSIMDTIDMSSPSDPASAIKKALATTSSPKVSPQLKNLVRSAIAGTSEDGPRTALSSPGSSAPTLSMLLEMPLRDSGQPLPEISAVSKAAQYTSLEPLTSPIKKPTSLLLDPINRSRVSPIKSSDKNSDKQSPNKSSSPTLKRLLEGNKDEAGQTKTMQEVSTVADIVGKAMEVQIKIEQVAAAAITDRNAEISLSPTFIKMEPGQTRLQEVSDTGENFSKALEGEIKKEQTTTPATTDRNAEKHAYLSTTGFNAPIEPGQATNIQDVSIVADHVSKSLEEEKTKEQVASAVTMDRKDEIRVASSLVFKGADAGQTKPEVSNIVDTAKPLVVENVKGQISAPSADPKSDIRVSSSLVFKNMESGQTSTLLEASNVADIAHKALEVEKNKEQVIVIATATKDGKAEGQSFEMLKPKTIMGDEMPDIVGHEMMDSDEGDDSRKKVLIPSKTYSRKERFENVDIEDEDDSSNSTYDSSMKRKSRSPSRVTSPVRSLKKPQGDSTMTKVETTPTPERRGRKQLISESKSIEKGFDTPEDETRVTRARAKPSPSRTPVQEETKQQPLDSLPSHDFESNPSSPSITTSSSTNLEEDNEQRRFRRNINIVLEQIKSHKNAGIFLKPITASSYLKIVKRPMDLSTIKKNLDSGQIRNVVAFERDVLLMFVNAIMYNNETTETYKMAKTMEIDVRGMLMNYKMTHGLLPIRMYQEQDSWFDSDSSSAKQHRSTSRRGRGRRSTNKSPSHGTESPTGSAAESGESESEMGDDIEPENKRKREKESSPDIVDGHGDTKTRRSLRMSCSQR